MPESITLLHISDMQFGKYHRYLAKNPAAPHSDFDNLSARLIADLDLLRVDHQLVPDLIICSGDLAEWALPKEFADAFDFLAKLAKHLGLAHDRVVVIPGNHDVSRRACSSYFQDCAGKEEAPAWPWFPKWQHYRTAFEKFYQGYPDITFTLATPWTWYAMHDLGVIVAGLNSTYDEGHDEPDEKTFPRRPQHHGLCEEDQLRAFSDRLDKEATGYLRIGTVHHNVVRGCRDDNAQLTDADRLAAILGDRLDFLLHGHTHRATADILKRKLPVYSTGSASLKTRGSDAIPTDIPNQYQLLRITATELTRYCRAYDGSDSRFIADTRLSDNGQDWVLTDKLELHGAHACLRSKDNDEPEADQTGNQVIFKTSLELASMSSDLSALPRLKLQCAAHHFAIRGEQRERAIQLLAEQRAVCLVGDWGCGINEFIATCVSPSNTDASMEVVECFVARCDAFETMASLEAGIASQFGRNLHQFLQEVRIFPGAILVLDGVQPALALGCEKETFQRVISMIPDFAPQLSLILVGRIPVHESISAVSLAGLDALETRAYLTAHPRTSSHLMSADAIERLHLATGGLPTQLDRLLERLEVASFDAVIEEESQARAAINSDDPFMKSLTQCLRMLADADGVGEESRCFKLLCALSVIPFGETIERMKHFLHISPFFASHAQSLASMALIEAIPVHQKREVSQQGFEAPSPNASVPKLLRVPKQIRDCLWETMAKPTRKAYLHAAASFIFGDKWSLGKVKLKRVPPEYKNHVSGGTGNEFAVIEALLAIAAADQSREDGKTVLRLGLHYCGVLKSTDRMRDLKWVAQSLIRLAENCGLTTDLPALHEFAGVGCRLTGDCHSALNHFESSVDTGVSKRSKASEGHRLIELAIAARGSGNNLRSTEALAAATAVAKPGSHLESQIKSQFATEIADAKAKYAELQKLESKARSKGWSSHANDIAIVLSSLESDEGKSISWLDRVLSSPEKERWNEFRAVVRKAKLMISRGEIESMGQKDRISLVSAYWSYHAQRQPGFDDSHDCLWELFDAEADIAALYSLFWNSSFIWRLRGDEKRETYFCEKLELLQNSLPISKRSPLAMLIEYFEKRAITLVLRLASGATKVLTITTGQGK